tara:strand:+ start:2938 stop:3267 length:330 start_codon:yes stop_codon:yes gene_type:complete
MKIFLALFIAFNIQLQANDFLVIDVRTSEEFKSGHIENAINIAWQEISSLSNNIKKEEKIYLYCRSGNRSQKAREILIKLGFNNVENLGSLSDAANFLKLKVVVKENNK